MRFLRVSLIVVFVTAVLVRPSFSQTPSPFGKTVTLKNPGDSLSDRNQQLGVERQLMQQQSFGPAADMLELMYEKQPQDPVVINLLRVCYGQLKQYPRAEILVRRQIEQDPNNFGTRLDLAELLADEGFKDSSRVAYADARNLIPPSDTIRFLTLLRSQISRNMNDEAVQLIDTLRHEFKDSTLYALERGQLLEHSRDYRGAIREYVSVVKADTGFQAMEVERRLFALLDFVDSAPEVEKALQEEARRTSNPFVIRLLADHYVKVNQLDKAFEYAVKRDSISGLQGASLTYLMHQCHDMKLYPQTVKIGDYIFSHYPKSPAYLDASLTYADALVHLGRTQEALGRYDQLVAASPRPQDKAEALEEMGMVYFDNLKDYSKALVYFDSVVSKYPNGLPWVNARRMRPYCYLRTGDRQKARTGFEGLKAQPVVQDIAEEVAYELAMLDFYDKQFDSANVELRRLIVDYPKGFYVNDALQILMAMDDAKSLPDLAGEFANALWFQECEQDDSSRAWLERMSNESGSALADDALYRLVELDLRMNDSVGASVAIERLTDSFPSSYFVPFALRQKADMLVSDPAKIDEAKALYKRILEQFSSYPFSAEVRKKLRQLEVDRKIG